MINNTFAVDLGTANIKIYNAATDKILVQKNMIAVENKKNMIAYGDSAYEMYEKSRKTSILQDNFRTDLPTFAPSA